MQDKYEAAFDEIVFAVTRLLFGDRMAAIEIYQRLVRMVLVKLGVEETICGLSK